MNTPQAQKKVREASFFRDHMSRAERERSNPEHFSFYLSAFLSAAKSAIEVVEFELKSGRYLKQWKDTLSEDDGEFFNDMMGFRDVEVHRDGVPTDVQQRAVSVEDMENMSQDRWTRALHSRLFALPAPLASEEIEEYKRLGIPPGTRAWVYVDDHYLSVADDRMKAMAACDRLLSLIVSFSAYVARLPTTGTSTQ
jgi:hypothetical protein